MPKETIIPTKCAIYTRKSTSEGLDEDFTTLDNQRESALNYIASQKQLGWTALPTQYDDGGFTGSNMERPALQRLIKDIQAGHIQCVVVYKVDRLSRSLLDFTKLLEFFDKYNVTFVSVTQHFNTNNSMGRLTLNILLSFAQFEREMISERTKDKMAAARRKGRWTGGRPPLGYDIELDNKRLIVNSREANIVRDIFDFFLKGLPYYEVARLINQKGYKTKEHISKNRKYSGGRNFGSPHIGNTLRNIAYIGKVQVGDELFEGIHDAIISEEDFYKARDLMEKYKHERKSGERKVNIGLLNNILQCQSCKRPMFQTYTLRKNKRRYNYYICGKANREGYHACPTGSINADQLENLMMDALGKIHQDPKRPEKLRSFIQKTIFLWPCLIPKAKRDFMKLLFKRIGVDKRNDMLFVQLAQEGIEIEIKTSLGKRSSNTFRKDAKGIHKEPRLVQVLALAHHIHQLVLNQKIDEDLEIAKYLNVSRTRLNQIYQFINLSPVIQESILSGRINNIHQISETQLREVAKQPSWIQQSIEWEKITL